MKQPVTKIRSRSAQERRAKLTAKRRRQRSRA